MCNDNGDTFITTLHNIHFSPDLRERLFSIITIMNSRNICLFYKEFCTVYFGDKEKNAVTLSYSTQWKYAFLGEIKQMPKSKELPPRKKVALE